jgi:PTH1 family peptidyl-tRNA hydrolase
MKLIVGLGNIGKEYDKTRHNIGFMVVDNYLKTGDYQEKFNSMYCKKLINNETVYFVKPKTYMNNSGIAVQQFVNYFDIDINDILVIQDDLDEEVGCFKLKKHSGSGGHNGIKSIISSLNSEDFLRLKIGISSSNDIPVIDYVLGKFSKEDLNKIVANMDTFNEIIDSFIINGADKTMNKYNTK